ncbi:hypothetical protein AAY81_04015 [Denitrobacterium detoxificans]|uniref:Uncharacterized protein n=1 Tax=Denitrobacterium detoxificans TaxID=79604 RepID=A0A172RXL9_9ACTN|nr:hypothetical protein [Denitrobacterium detoxificans]ANE22424.1 hypothetical protein AAY81_04015 [Denitrobacterium detoxificans]SEO81822.1 hypothetical protein SAMN02910314_01308 [Denitrobacterium detoxificans]SEP01754.1 hypothetical protein SAMN02910314_01932 [Denitrobacterium detoxificans]
MSKFTRAFLRGKPLDKDCQRAYGSGVEFRDENGNEYCGCYGLEDAGPGATNPECLECHALARAIDQETIEWAIGKAMKVVQE